MGFSADPPAVLTYHNDASRTGANLKETVLNASTVTASGFGKVFSRPVDDQIYSQLLYMPGVTVPNRGTHNVIFAATVNDSVYAFDADYPALNLPLWKVNFLTPGAVPATALDLSDRGACGGNYHDFAGSMGIVGTPVIDPTPFPGASADDQGTLYLVARTKENGVFYQRLHALDVQTGEERPGSPVEIQYSGTYQGTALTFDPILQNQRPGLALVNGHVYIGWAAHCDLGVYHGWLISYDAHTLQQSSVFCTTPDGQGGGIWMGGSPPAFDDEGNLYLSTGNGTVGINDNNLYDRGESFMKLIPSAGTTTATDSSTSTSASGPPVIASYFTPYNYPQLEAGDIDLGSSGLLLFPGSDGQNLAIGAGKQGRLYVVDRDDMGGVQLGSDSQIVQSIDVSLNNKIMGSPVYWQGPDGVKRFYIWAANSPLKAYTYNGATFNTTPATSTMTTSNPGAMLSLSANDSQAGTGIVWAMCPTDDANPQTVLGVLRAFNAEDISQELWNSTMNASRDGMGSYAKFNQPTVVNGNVYVPTFSNQLLVYGQITSVSNPDAPAELTATAVSKLLVHLAWSAPTDDTRSGFIVERSTDGTNFDQIMNLTADARGYDDTMVARFTRYTYRVRSFSLTGSSLSATATATTNTGTLESEIAVSGGGLNIPAGSDFPLTENGTDFGQLPLGSGAGPAHVFTIRNNGNAALILRGSPVVAISGANAADFTVTALPAAFVTSLSTASFSIVFTPQAAGMREALVTILTNDPQAKTFTFAITGRGTQQDIVALWHFDDDRGSILAQDSTGRGHSGVPKGSGAFVPVFGGEGHFDTAVAFSPLFASAIQPYLTVPDATDLNPADGLTISCWLYWNGMRSGYVQPIVQKGTSEAQYLFYIQESTVKLNFNRVGLLSAPLTANAGWVHIAATYDGAMMCLYLNGNRVAYTASTGRMSPTTSPVFIGGQPGSPNHLNGQIDDLRIYARGLSPAEVQKLAAQRAAVSLTATAPLAQKKGASGQFEFTAPGSDGDLNVNFEIVSGTGQAIYRSDYGMSIIPPQAALPPGSEALQVAITPLSFNTPTGPLDVTLRVLEGDGYAVGKNSTAVVHVLDSGFNQWLIEQFGGVQQAQASAAAEDADPAGDGVSNLMKYALGMPAMSPGQPETNLHTQRLGGADYMIMSFAAANPLPADIQYVPEWQAGDLSGEWQPADMDTWVFGDITVVVASCPLPLVPGVPLFMRLRVESL